MIIFENRVQLKISLAFMVDIKSRVNINNNIFLKVSFLLDIKKPAYAGFFMAPYSILENGARGRTRTGTLCGRGILNPLCLPISPPGHERNNRGQVRDWQEKIREFALFSISSCLYLYKLINFCHDLFIKLRSAVHLMYLTLKHSLLITLVIL